MTQIPKPKTAEQLNREQGLATTGKEIPPIPSTLRKIAQIEEAQAILNKKLSDVELAIEQSRQQGIKEVLNWLRDYATHGGRISLKSVLEDMRVHSKYGVFLKETK